MNILQMTMQLDKLHTDSPAMVNLLDRSNARLTVKIEEIVEGKVLLIEGTEVFIDLGHLGTGIIYGREFMNSREIIKNLNIGDTITGKVVDVENEDGYIELSLKEARQALIWSEAEKMIHEKTVLALPVKEANKGGLMLEWNGINGFLPASQLKADHYPRVDDGNKEDILRELKKLVGVTLGVQIISINVKEGKLIFSEKGGEDTEKKQMITKYNLGDEVECEVTGAVDFGVFLKLEDGLEGLVHISELDWSLVEDPKSMFKVGQKVHAKIISISDDKVSLSIKALKPNPWKNVEGKYNKDDRVTGVVIKYNKHGALVSIEEGVAGLIHVSEFGSQDALKEALQLGKSYEFKISLFDAGEQRMTLVLDKKEA
jgi:small subunit ribosomal protein S1